MKHGEEGERVRALQRKLIALGYPLPRWGDDGDFGDETIRAALNCLMDFGLEAAGDWNFKGLLDEHAQMILDAPLPGRPDWLHDVTMAHPVKFAYPYRRKISRIDAITLHQTGCNLSERLKRWHSIAAHFGITRLGKVIKINTLDVIPFASNWFNHRSIAIEISGNFRGVESKAWTLWKKGGRRAKMSYAQIVGARRAVELGCDDVAWAGGEIKYVLGHRQANEDKRTCPGELIWRNVGLWAQKELGLESDPNYVHPKSNGLPIPGEWDERSSHGY